MGHKSEKGMSIFLAGLLLLSACSAPAVEVTPSPAPSPSETVTPSATPTATPEPTEEVETLWGFPIDETHDAFEVDTKGKLGTLLVTVERGELDNQVYDGYSTTLSVWDPQEMEKPIQEMEKATYNAFHWHEEVDANFDGYTDFSYMYAMGNQPSYWYLWIWDEEAGQFVEEPEYSTISWPRINPETQVIDGWFRESVAGDGVTTFHRWEDGKLVCIRRVSAFCPWGETATLLVEDRLDGALQEVYYAEFPWEVTKDETEGMESWRQERCRWENLDYHGEEG